MVKTKKTTNNSSNDNKENDAFVLTRDTGTNIHSIIPLSKLTTTKSLGKVGAGDEVGYGQKKDRTKATVLVTGTENQCKKSLILIERANKSTAKFPNEKKKQDVVTKDRLKKNVPKLTQVTEDERSDSDQEEIDSNQSEEDTLHIDEDNIQADEEDDQIDQQDSGDDEDQSTTNDNASNVIVPPMLSTKRKLSSSVESDEKATKKRLSVAKSIPRNVHTTLQKKVENLEAQVLEYQTTWMPRPTNKETIDYLINISNVLSGINKLDKEEKGELLFDIMETLEMTEKELEKCKGNGIRVTVRRIMKAKYPSPLDGFKFADVEREYVEAARAYGRLMHPQEESLYTDGDLNHSMGNVFAATAHQNRAKEDLMLKEKSEDGKPFTNSKRGGNELRKKRNISNGSQRTKEIDSE